MATVWKILLQLDPILYRWNGYYLIYSLSLVAAKLTLQIQYFAWKMTQSALNYGSQTRFASSFRCRCTLIISLLLPLNAREAKVIWFQGNRHISSRVIIPTQGFGEACSSVALRSGADNDDTGSRGHHFTPWRQPFVPQTYIWKQMNLWLQLQDRWAQT